MEPIIREHVETGSQLMTDDFQTGWWTPQDFEHQAINHLESYVEGNCHTNLITVLEPDPASSGTLTTAYAYDWMNHVAQVTMTRGSTTQNRTFNYNDQCDLRSSVTPESGTGSYYYNANHTLWYKHDAKGQDRVYSYDSSLRVTEIQRYTTGMSNTEDACARVTNYYNTNPFNPTFSANTVNRLAASAFGSWGASGCLAGENQHRGIRCIRIIRRPRSHRSSSR